MHFVRHGLNNRQIAARFGVSSDAVTYHVENITTKLGVEARAPEELVRRPERQRARS